MAVIPSRPKVYTYHAPALSADPPKPLIYYWRISWLKAGWDPVILGPEVARQHPRFEDYDRHIRSLPTVNKLEYEVACYHRWLALEVVGGGLMVDYDLLCYGFTVEDIPHKERRTLLFLDPGRVPCAVWTTKTGAAEIVHYIQKSDWDGITQVNGRPHTSDMIILQSHNGDIHPVVTEVGKVGWDQAKLVHFANGAVNKVSNGLWSKSDTIWRLRRP